MLPNAVFTGDDGADSAPSFTPFPLAETVTFSARVLDGLRGDDAKFLASFPRLRTARFSSICSLPNIIISDIDYYLVWFYILE